METRLKVDILAEAELYEGQILVTDENDDFTTFDLMLQVSASDVQTPREVFDELHEDGYNVHYERIPVTDEKVCAQAQRGVRKTCICFICIPRMTLKGAR